MDYLVEKQQRCQKHNLCGALLEANSDKEIWAVLEEHLWVTYCMCANCIKFAQEIGAECIHNLAHTI